MSTNTDPTTLVDRLLEHLAEKYIFPERTAHAAAVIRAGLDRGAYRDVDGAELCRRISADLLEACDDKQLRLIWHETPMETPDEAELHAALREQIRLENHGVRRVELLPDNIGLIELTIVPEPSSGGPTLAAAMQLVQNTDALFFDLRPTRGGSPD